MCLLAVSLFNELFMLIFKTITRMTTNSFYSISSSLLDVLLAKKGKKSFSDTKKNFRFYLLCFLYSLIAVLCSFLCTANILMKEFKNFFLLVFSWTLQVERLMPFSFSTSLFYCFEALKQQKSINKMNRRSFSVLSKKRLQLVIKSYTNYYFWIETEWMLPYTTLYKLTRE